MTQNRQSIEWIAVAFGRDLPPLAVTPIHVDGRDLVLWRSATGRVAAWADRCPHRGMRLSHGFVRGEALSCIYHGWSYGAEGQCLRVPAHPDLAPPEAIRVPIHAACEVGELIWVAQSHLDTPLPDLTGLSALRSVTIEAAVTALPDLSAQSDGTLRGMVEGVQVAIVLHAVASDRTLLHVLTAAAPPDTLVAISRWVEIVRHQAERVAA